MDRYMIELFGGGKIEITQEEYQGLLGNTGLILLKSCGQTINTSAIKRIAPMKDYLIDELEERRHTQKEGVLHDGTRVYRHYGVWYFESLHGEMLVADPAEYPEVARDCVPTKDEYYRKYADLQKKERLALIVQKVESISGGFQARSGEMKSIGEDMERYKDMK